MVSVVGIKYGRIDWYERFCMILQVPVLRFMAILRNVIVIFKLFPPFGVFFHFNNCITTTIRHFITTNINLALQLVTLQLLLFVSDYLLNRSLVKNPVSTAAEKLIVTNFEPKPEEAYEEMFNWTLHYFQCPISSRTCQTYPALLLQFSQLTVDIWLRLSLTTVKCYWTTNPSWKVEIIFMQITNCKVPFKHFSSF